jgi:hypothetical protein
VRERSLLTCVRSPPLRRVDHPGRDGLAVESPEMTPKAVFSEGRTLCVRSAGPHECRGIPFSPADEPRGRLAYRAHASVRRKPTLWACGARPSAGLVIRARMALRGKAGNNVGGGFLGGARSPRPYGQAVRKPGHNKIIGGKRVPGGQMGTCSGEANSVLAGVRSPPLRGEGRSGQGGLAVESPEMTRKAIFSEGRGLRAREYRPYASPRYVMMTGRQATARWPSRDMSRVKPVPFLPGVRSPPFRLGASPVRMALRGKPQMTRKVVSSEGRGLRVRVVRPDASRGIT